MKIRSLILIAAAAACSSLGGCRGSGGGAEASKPVITVSIEPQRWLLERIVGDRMEVNTLLANGGNPESYEPAFSHLADLERSSCYMQVGHLGFERAVLDKIKINNPGLPVVDTSEDIDLIVDDHVHSHGVDPHVWSSPRNARVMAGNMLEAVVELDEDNADYYRANFKRLEATIDSIDGVCGALLDGADGRVFMVMHPSLSYFARDYGLRQLAVGAEGKEHSVQDTRALLDEASENNVSVFLVDKDFNATNAAVLSGNGIRVATINPLNYEWGSELVQTAHAIAGK